jgi:putative exporter of polyketide antibiotics
MNQWPVILRLYRGNIIGWSAGVGGYILLMGLVYAAMGGAEGLADLAEAYPQEILEVFGAEDLTSANGFLSVDFGAFAPLIFALFIIKVVTKYLAGAEVPGALDQALARPISRNHYFWQLMAAAGTIVVIVIGVASPAAALGFAFDA